MEVIVMELQEFLDYINEEMNKATKPFRGVCDICGKKTLVRDYGDIYFIACKKCGGWK